MFLLIPPISVIECEGGFPGKVRPRLLIGINRGSSRLAVAHFQLLAHKGKADVPIDEPQKMSLRNLIFQAKVVEQRFGTGLVPHHE